MTEKKKEELFELSNGDWIFLSSVSALIFEKEWKIGDTIYPANVTVERMGHQAIKVKFDSNEAAEKYRAVLAGEVNTL